MTHGCGAAAPDLVPASQPQHVQRAQQLLAESQRQYAWHWEEQLLRAASLDTLPRDLQLAILSRCATSDLAAVAVTCSRLRNVAQSDELWRGAAPRAFAWRPALAAAVRRAVTQASWLRPSGNSDGESTRPNMRSNQPGSSGQPDGTEWLVTRAGTRLRLLRVQLRHTEPGVLEACLAFCADLLQLWQEDYRGGLQGWTTMFASTWTCIDWSLGGLTEHFLQAARIISTLVADAIALQLRAVLAADDGLRPAGIWQLVGGAAEAYDAWLQHMLRAVWGPGTMPAKVSLPGDGDLNAARGGAAAFRSQVLLASPVRRELQLAAAAAVCRLHKAPGGGVRTAPAAANGCAAAAMATEANGASAAATQLPPVASGHSAALDVRAMARLIARFDVEGERRTYWWNRDGAHAASHLRTHFQFILETGGGQA